MRISDWSLDVCSSDLLVRPDIGRGDICHRFADAPEILERNALGQQRTAGSCDGGQRQWLRRQAIYKLRRLFLQRVEKLPRLVHAEHLRRIKRDQMVEVRRNDRWRIDDGIARDHGSAAHVIGNPDRIQPEGRVLRFRPEEHRGGKEWDSKWRTGRSAYD